MIERDHLESKFRDVESALDQTAEAAKNVGIALAIGVVVVIVVAFFFGRRKGQKGAAQLEIYRLG